MQTVRYTLREQNFQGTRVPRSKNSIELSFPGAKRPGSERARERKFQEREGQGAKGPGSEMAKERKFQGANWPGSYWPLRGANWPGSEKAWYRVDIVYSGQFVVYERCLDASTG